MGPLGCRFCWFAASETRLSHPLTTRSQTVYSKHPGSWVLTSNTSTPVLRHLARIERLTLADAGRKVAKRYKIHIADAIDPAPVKHIRRFMTKKFPQLLKLMSPQRRAEASQPGTTNRQATMPFTSSVAGVAQPSCWVGIASDPIARRPRSKSAASLARMRSISNRMTNRPFTLPRPCMKSELM
jgi:hypothetical protein